MAYRSLHCNAGHRFLVCLVLVLCLLSDMARGEPWWRTDGETARREALTDVFGDALVDWTFTRNRRPHDPESSKWRERTVLASTPKIFWGMQRSGGDGREYLFTLGFPGSEGVRQRFDLLIGDPRTRPQKIIRFSLYRRHPQLLQVRATNYLEMRGGRPLSASSLYAPQGHNTMQLGWPEEFRRRVEAQFAQLPALEEQWVRFRVVLANGRCRGYMNGQLFADWPVNAEELAETISCTLMGGAVMADARVQAVRPDDRFTTVDISSILNSDRLQGQPVARDSLPTPEKRVVVDGVPFTFPAPDERGNDHVDVGASWFQHGYLEGYFSSHYNRPFGSRWAHGLLRNPGRLQVMVPQAQYCRLHLIVAADGEADSVPQVTAQFYRPYGGYPQEVSATVPRYDAADVKVTPLPVQRGGRQARLYHVVIPIDPGRLTELALMDREAPVIGLEFTKPTRLYRSYPDPISYSLHGGGLPSSAHIYAATLERPLTRIRVEPNAVGHVWTSPARPAYTIALAADGNQARAVSVEVVTRSYDGEEQTKQTKPARLVPGREGKLVFNLPVKRFGYHALTVTMRDGEQVWTEKRGFALLHPDTRDRDWQPGRGPVFGTWSYSGGHTTPPLEYSLPVMGQAGLQARGGNLYHILFADSRRWPTEQQEKLRAICAKYKLFSFKQFSAGDHWTTGAYARDLSRGDAEQADKTFLEALRKQEAKPTPFSRTEMISFFPEPHVRAAPNLPVYYGEPPHQLTEAEQKKFNYYGRAILRGSKLVRKHWPDVKIIMPHGDPMFTVPFLRAGQEYVNAFDGVAVDSPGFERVPEMQAGNYTIHRQWQVLQEMKKAGKKDIYWIFLEGNFLPTNPGALTLAQQADYQVRNTLHYYAYGIDRLATIVIDYDAADYYGEEHYGAGICTRYPLACPKPAYAAMATLTRQLNGMNFAKYVPTGSATVFCIQFRHWKDADKILHILWTVRGKRPVRLAAAPKANVRRYDQMDNVSSLTVQKGEVALTLDDSPCYVWGLGDAPTVKLGPPDHSDSRPGEHIVALGNLGDGSWQKQDVRDETYENNWPGQIARFLGKMSVKAVDAPKAHGGRALAVQFGSQEKERITMPWYTTLVPKAPVRIPGKASHIGLWVRANSDWGRIVYSLRDAEGERWISIGTREQWNCDDIHCWSKFCFDGWRYLRFELPANSPYDQFREAGSTWWGHFGKGDGVVQLPLILEKIIVERRSHVMYVNEPIPADTGDVLLGQMNAEYKRPQDAAPEAIRLASLKMPLPTGKVDLDNPVAELREQGTLPPPTITRVEDPKHQANGRQCHVYFKPVKDAVAYDIWVSPYEDGRGAMKLAGNWKEPGNMLRGVRPEVDFYLFLVYRTKGGKQSKPSPAFHIKLKDLFFQK